MQYLLTEEEYLKLERNPDKDKTESLLNDLRTKVLTLANFKCLHQITDVDYEKGLNVDEGYCDNCPLSFCKNENLKMKHYLCGCDTLYSK